MGRFENMAKGAYLFIYSFRVYTHTQTDTHLDRPRVKQLAMNIQ